MMVWLLLVIIQILYINVLSLGFCEWIPYHMFFSVALRHPSSRIANNHEVSLSQVTLSRIITYRLYKNLYALIDLSS
jgi:hypothetical protein